MFCFCSTGEAVLSIFKSRRHLSTKNKSGFENLSQTRPKYLSRYVFPQAFKSVIRALASSVRKPHRPNPCRVATVGTPFAFHPRSS